MAQKEGRQRDAEVQEYYDGHQAEFTQEEQLRARHILIRLKEDADEAAANSFVERLELFGIGYSWGAFESLAIPVHPERGRTIRREKLPGTLIRLHIGLEDPDDLVADLEQGLKQAG